MHHEPQHTGFRHTTNEIKRIPYQNHALCHINVILSTLVQDLGNFKCINDENQKIFIDGKQSSKDFKN